jgi:hypothetical protein
VKLHEVLHRLLFPERRPQRDQDHFDTVLGTLERSPHRYDSVPAADLQHVPVLAPIVVEVLPEPSQLSLRQLSGPACLFCA